MKKTLLAVVLAGALAFPVFARDMIGMGLSVGVGANKDLMDAGYTAVDLSFAASLSLLPLQIDDLAAGVTVRVTGGSTILEDDIFVGWYALTPMFTLAFFDDSPMSISVGYGPYAYADFPDFYIYDWAVLLGFQFDSTLMEIGLIGPSVFVGFGFGF